MESFEQVYKKLIEYRNSNGELHREDGPAYISKSGFVAWYINGKKHREDGPAVEYPNGSKQWYLHGKLHREDGPAIISEFSTQWCLNGIEYSEQDYKKELIKIKFKRIENL